VKAEWGDIGEGGGEANGAGLLLAGEIGLGPLFVEVREGGTLGADEVESGGAADFLESFAEELLFPIGGGFGKKSEELPLFGTTGADFREGGHGIAANFLCWVLKEREEPLSDGFFERGLRCLGKSSADSTDKSDGAELFIRRGQVEARDFLFPKAEPREGAEFPIQIFRGMSDLLGHKGASVWGRGNSIQN
jgi:hypothetical protein